MSTISRRQAIAGAATVGIGVPLLAACGDDGSDPKADASDPASSSSAPDPSTDATSGSSGPGSEPPAGGLVPTADVPVGGGVVLTDEKIVVTQPADGEFKAFTAVCTHAGCLVARVSSEIECDCHGSRFSIEDGSVAGGPAPSALSEVPITVSGDEITLG